MRRVRTDGCDTKTISIGVDENLTDTSFSGCSLLSAQDTTECWCDKGPLPSGQAFARGSDVTMEVSGQPGIAIQGGVGILLQTTEARSISCMALRASPGVQAWDWRVEGRPTQGKPALAGLLPTFARSRSLSPTPSTLAHLEQPCPPGPPALAHPPTHLC